MHVDGVSAPNGNAYGLEKGGSQDLAGEPQVVNSGAAEEGGEEGQGVIGLLQEGHFKGVADVRLRINFFDELAAIEAGELKTAAEGSIKGVLGAVGGDAESVLSLSEAPEEDEEGLQGLQEAFAAAVNGAKEEFMGAEMPSKDGLVDAINWAFEAFIEGLQELFGPEPELMEEEALAPSMEESLESYISGLKEAFETAMGDFSGALDGVVVLPELSQPSGNGVAYEKFLAIYNEMLGLEVVSEGSEGAGAVDATA